MILGQDAKTIFNDCNQMRGAMLAADKFETRHINKMAPGEQIHGFIVAPTATYSAASMAGQKMEYQSYGIYAVDRKTLQHWQPDENEKKLHFLFNKNNDAATGNGKAVFPTHSAAHEQARQLNRQVYNDYLQDYQTGRHAGISQWEETPAAPYGNGAGVTVSVSPSSTGSSVA